MDDFDAKNHLRDVHREADLRRLARLAKAGAAVKQPGWVSQQAGRLLYALGNGLARLGERMKREREAATDSAFVEQQGQEGLS
jgi:hypothetical protein